MYNEKFVLTILLQLVFVKNLLQAKPSRVTIFRTERVTKHAWLWKFTLQHRACLKEHLAADLAGTFKFQTKIWKFITFFVYTI